MSPSTVEGHYDNFDLRRHSRSSRFLLRRHLHDLLALRNLARQLPWKRAGWLFNLIGKGLAKWNCRIQ
jgi:hypothetical protein